MRKPLTKNKVEYDKLRLIIRSAMDKTKLEESNMDKQVAQCASWQWNELYKIFHKLGFFEAEK